MLIDLLKYGNTLCAVEHSFNSKKKPVFNVLSLKKKKKELEVIATKSVDNQGEVISFLNTQKHIFLAINDEKILTKKSVFFSENSLEIVQNTFQNININDFYYQVDTNNYSSFVTICRKAHIDSLIDLYSEKGISIIGFSLGNSVVNNISSYVNSEILYTSNAKITLEKGEINTIESQFKNEDYIINGLHIANNYVLALSSVLYGYFKNGTTRVSYTDKIALLNNTFLDKRIFKLGLNFSLGFLLIVLLANFLFFSSYSSKINELSSELLVDESQKTQVTRLKGKITIKEALIKNLNNVLQSDISKKIDEIAVTVPTSILLEELSYQPLQSTIRFDKKMLFNEASILVKGVTKKDADFSLWTSNLGRKEWIKEIIFKDFSNGKRGNNNFEFLIKLKNE